MSTIKKLPAEIAVKIDSPEPGEDYLLATHLGVKDFAMIGEKVKVGIYKLVRIEEVSGVVQSRTVRK